MASWLVKMGITRSCCSRHMSCFDHSLDSTMTCLLMRTARGPLALMVAANSLAAASADAGGDHPVNQTHFLQRVPR